MTLTNYDKLLKLLDYANVNEDFLINYDSEIQELITKLDLLEKFAKNELTKYIDFKGVCHFYEYDDYIFNTKNKLALTKQEYEILKEILDEH